MLEIPQGPNGLILVHRQHENELREHDTGLVRWDWSILVNPAAFIRRLESAGLRRR
jgi:hypothetical protein